jgi:hypothetical protein
MLALRIQLALVVVLTIASAILVAAEYWGP